MHRRKSIHFWTFLLYVITLMQRAVSRAVIRKAAEKSLRSVARVLDVRRDERVRRVRRDASDDGALEEGTDARV